MKVSIALATYNGSRFLKEQLNTLASQTLSPFELIVSDDGSNDQTLDLVRAFARHAPFAVKILEGESRLGYRENFRRAANHSTGDLIAFCDQDDIWRADKLDRMHRVFEDPSVLLAYHNAVVFNGVDTRLLHSARVEEADLRQEPVPPFKSSNGLLQVFRRDLLRFDSLWDISIDQNEGDVILAHDQWFFFLALVLGDVRFIDAPLLDYRQHGGNTYGVATKVSFAGRIAKQFLHYGAQDRWGADSARSRARIVEQIMLQEPSYRLGDIATFYRLLAQRLARRSSTYCEKSIAHRAAALLRSAASGDYRGGSTGFRPSSLIRDVWAGTVRGKSNDPTHLKS